VRLTTSRLTLRSNAESHLHWSGVVHGLLAALLVPPRFIRSATNCATTAAPPRGGLGSDRVGCCRPRIGAGQLRAHPQIVFPAAAGTFAAIDPRSASRSSNASPPKPTPTGSRQADRVVAVRRQLIVPTLDTGVVIGRTKPTPRRILARPRSQARSPASGPAGAVAAWGRRTVDRFCRSRGRRTALGGVKASRAARTPVRQQGEGRRHQVPFQSSRLSHPHRMHRRLPNRAQVAGWRRQGSGTRARGPPI